MRPEEDGKKTEKNEGGRCMFLSGLKGCAEVLYFAFHCQHRLQIPSQASELSVTVAL